MEHLVVHPGGPPQEEHCYGEALNKSKDEHDPHGGHVDGLVEPQVGVVRHEALQFALTHLRGGGVE